MVCKQTPVEVKGVQKYIFETFILQGRSWIQSEQDYSSSAATASKSKRKSLMLKMRKMRILMIFKAVW